MPVEVKTCGLSDRPAVDAALAGGARFLGFVFFPPSPRNVSPGRAAALTAGLPDDTGTVGVVVNPDDEFLDGILSQMRLDYIQLHGNESPARAQAVRARTGCRIIKAISVSESSDIQRAEEYGESVDLILFDAKSTVDDTRPGGNARAFDWRLFETAPPPSTGWFLSGGLDAENVGEAIRVTGARAVDVSSGIESAPGHKDPMKISAFLAAAAGGKRADITRGHAMSARGANRPGPDADGHFGIYGGRYVAETLMPLILDLEAAYETARGDPEFAEEFERLLAHYVGRPSPLYHAERLSAHLGGARIYFKRDELNHTGAHKINNCIGQILLARRMGKTRIIAETGAGQHGVATATVCALFGLPCTVYMGETDIERQQPNVFRMKLLGAEVVPVNSGSRTLKDAMNEALRDWVTNVETTFYLIGTVAGPHPYPAMVRDFQSVIGRETREQIMAAEGRLPDTLVACVGGGSNAIGLFHPFLDEEGVRMGGRGGRRPRCGQWQACRLADRRQTRHPARQPDLSACRTSTARSPRPIRYRPVSTIPASGPEHAWLKDSGRVTYVAITDEQALDAFHLCARLEGIIPALEPAHALAHVVELAPSLPSDHILVMNMCGRGDKDIFTVADTLGTSL